MGSIEDRIREMEIIRQKEVKAVELREYNCLVRKINSILRQIAKRIAARPPLCGHVWLKVNDSTIAAWRCSFNHDWYIASSGRLVFDEVVGHFIEGDSYREIRKPKYVDLREIEAGEEKSLSAKFLAPLNGDVGFFLSYNLNQHRI